MKQHIFDFNLLDDYSSENFFVSTSNSSAFNYVLSNKIINNCIIKGPNKSGKTHLGLIWTKKNDSIIYNDQNYEFIISQKKNIFINNIFNNLNEEKIFHIINHCNTHNLNMLITSNISLNDYIFKLKDLESRLRSFNYIEIDNPDDLLLNNLLIKLLSDKQIIVKNDEIFAYILKRINRTYLDIFKFVEKVDKLSLETKRELTIPFIKKLLY